MDLSSSIMALVNRKKNKEQRRPRKLNLGIRRIKYVEVKSKSQAGVEYVKYKAV